jgi:hypothetical protein
MPIHDPATLEKFRQAATACRAANRIGHHPHHPQPPPLQHHGPTIGLTPAVGVVAAVSRSPCPSSRQGASIGQPSSEPVYSHGHRTSSVTAETAFHNQHHNHHHHQQHHHPPHNSLIHNHASASVDEDHPTPMSVVAADSKRRVFRRRKTFSAEPASSSSAASRWLQLFPVKFGGGGSSTTVTALPSASNQEGPVSLMRTSRPHPPSEDDDEPGMGSDVEAKLLQRRRHPSEGDQLSTAKKAVIRPTIIGVGRDQRPQSSARGAIPEPGVVVGRTNVGVTSPVSSSSPDSGRHSRDTPVTSEPKIDQESYTTCKGPPTTTTSSAANCTSAIPPLSPPPDYQLAIGHSPTSTLIPSRLAVSGLQKLPTVKAGESTALHAAVHTDSAEAPGSSNALLTVSPVIENEDESFNAGLIDVVDVDENEAEHCPLAEGLRQPISVDHGDNNGNSSLSW